MVTTNEEQETAVSLPLPQKFLIVGLGNPGRRYQQNRHNIGFMVVDKLAADWHIELNHVQQKAIIGDGRFQDHTVILAKPQTYMNLSGDSVGPLARYYRIPAANTLVIYDELDLPLGTLRLRGKGGAGGHNGMRSIIQHLGEDFPRLRLGIGRPPGQMPPAAYVLQNFSQEEQLLTAEIIDESVKAITTFLSDGLDLAMSRHNKNLAAEG